MATQAKVIIKGENNISSAVKSASNDLNALKGSVEKIGSVLKTAFSVTAIVTAIKGIGTAAKTVMTEDFGMAERAYRQLALALKDQSAYDSVVDNINRLAKVTLSGNDEIESMVAELAALGKSSDDINRISEAAVILSNITGRDLKSSMTTLLSSMNGTTTQLRRLGIDLDGVTKEALEQGAAIDILIEDYGEYSSALAEDSVNQSLKNISETWGDIKEKIGGVLTYNFGPWLKQFDTAFEAVSKNINNITTYVGAIIANAPEVFSLLMETLWKMVKKTFEWESLKTIFITVVENIVILVSGALKLIVTSIPEIIKGLLNALISYVKYLALSIEAEIIGAIEKAVNWVGREINDTWVGEKLGWGEELAVADFGADSKKNVARGYYNAAASSIEHIGDPIKEGIATISETLEAAGRNTMDAINSIYGDIGIEFRDSLNEIVAPELEEIRSAADAANQTEVLSSIKDSTERTADATEGTETNTGTIASEGLSGNGSGRKSLSEMAESGLSGLFRSMSKSGGFTGIFGTVLSETIGPIMDTVQPLIDIVNSVADPMEVLLRILEGFVNVMEPAMQTVVQPLLDAFTWIGESIASWLLPILDQLHVAMSLIGNILTTVMAPVFQILAPLFQIVALALNTLNPILILCAKVFTILMAPVQFVADLFTWLGDWISYLGNCIYVFCWNLTHWFNQKGYGSSPGGFSSDAFSGLQQRLDNIDNLALNGNTAATDSVSTSTAIGSASYRGATSVTINIYQMSPVVGDGGMKTFARMIRREFEELDYYGVTT